MPLNPAILYDALYKLSTSDKPPDALTAASKIAAAYRDYAGQGLALGMPLVAPGPAVATMDLSLGAAFSVLPGLPPVVAAGYGAMVTAYWAGATFSPSPLPGIAAPPIAVPALIATLSALLVVPNPAEVHALSVATALDVCTRTVLVTFPQPPPAPPLISPVV